MFGFGEKNYRIIQKGVLGGHRIELWIPLRSLAISQQILTLNLNNMFAFPGIVLVLGWLNKVHCW